jgi:hypothetical protein
MPRLRSHDPDGRITPLDVALGEAPADEAARAMEDPAFRAEVELLAPAVARLEHQPRETWDPPAPPPLQVGAPAPVRPRPRRRASFVLRPAVGFAASLVLIAGGVILGIALDADDGPAGERVTLAALPGAQGQAELVRRDGHVELAATGLRPDRRGFHELWLLPADGKGAPVPIGRFEVGDDGRATATYRLPGDPSSYALFDISEEPDDGDPQHSGKSVLQAPTNDAS